MHVGRHRLRLMKNISIQWIEFMCHPHRTCPYKSCSVITHTANLFSPSTLRPQLICIYLFGGIGLLLFLRLHASQSVVCMYRPSLSPRTHSYASHTQSATTKYVCTIQYVHIKTNHGHNNMPHAHDQYKNISPSSISFYEMNSLFCSRVCTCSYLVRLNPICTRTLLHVSIAGAYSSLQQRCVLYHRSYAHTQKHTIVVLVRFNCVRMCYFGGFTENKENDF